MRSAFETLHRKRFGYVDEAEPVLDTLTVDAIASSPAVVESQQPLAGLAGERIQPLSSTRPQPLWSNRAGVPNGKGTARSF